MIAWWLIPTATCLTLLLTGLWRRYALARSLVDVPNARSSHILPTPRGGGIAIGLTFLGSLPVLWLADALSTPVLWGLLGAGSLVALIGCLDDHCQIAPYWRLLVHFTAAGWIVAWVGGLPPLPVSGFTLDLGWAGHLIMMVYLVWLLNLYNFMDGIDGIAGIEAVTVCLGGALVYALAVPGGEGWMVPVLLLAAVAGFLVWNFPRARIFMGDAGSGFLGLILGALSIQHGWAVPELFWSWVILLGTFIVDATVTLIRRSIRGENIFRAHHSHAYQQAARIYGSHRAVTLAVLAINIAWLLPLAAAVATGWLQGSIGVVVAYLPLIGLAYHLKAGARELQVDVNPGDRLLHAGGEMVRSSGWILKKQIGRANFWILLAVDLTLLIAAYFLSHLIRFDGMIDLVRWGNFHAVLLPLLGCKLVSFYFFGLYRGMWRYTSLTDLLNILKACVAASFVIVGILLLANRFEGFSRSVFVLDAILTFLFIAGFRIGLRLYYQSSPGMPFLQTHAAGRIRRKKLLIIGAGDAAEKLTREINDNGALPYQIAGFLDDSFAKVGQRLHGIPVLGPIGELPLHLRHTAAQEILIAIPSASRKQMNRIVELCRQSGVPFKTLPGLGELIADKVSIKSVRDVSYKDLLGRPPVRLELDKIGEILGGRTVLVTGAGGSIGSELCRQILRFKPERLILFDAGEQNLYQVEMEILHEHGFSNYVTVLGKVQDWMLLEHVFQDYRPAVVFHAAAYKHVPMVECNPWEGIFNNVFASRRLMEISVRFRVERFILVSTDKAVRPTNVMGATKRMTEIIMQALSGNGGSTKFMAVRFGNVLGSSGSVIPLFRRQIELGGPVTVTHPEVTRYFMSIDEAAQLILQAAAMGSGGEIFILEMGTPVRIAQMARDLIRLCGKEPDTEVAIKYTGLRPGEKMYEELITEGEGIITTDHEKIMVLHGKFIPLEKLQEPLAQLKYRAQIHDAEGIKAVLRKVIPEYTPQNTKSILLARPHARREDLQAHLHVLDAEPKAAGNL